MSLIRTHLSRHLGDYRPPHSRTLDMNTNESLKKDVPANALGMVIQSAGYAIKYSQAKGRGFYVTESVPAGTLVILEAGVVVGPKQASPLVCVECFTTLSSTEFSCTQCGSTLCQPCSKLDLKVHAAECQIFQSAGKVFDPRTDKGARTLYSLITPLRFLLKSESHPELLDLHDNGECRKDTLIHVFNQATVVHTIGHGLTLGSRFSDELIQQACGILDTNCYELGWSQLKARGLFFEIAHINHDCVPNSFKYFDHENRMCVVAARDLKAGEEVTLSYTPPLMSTSLRQVILQQTKHFVCHCQRCQDPAELGANLSALKCSDCGGDVLPIEPLLVASDLQCQTCLKEIPSDRGKMMVDTAMKFVGQGSGNTTTSEDTLAVIRHLGGRFLSPTHHLIVDLKLRFLVQLLRELEPRDRSNVESLGRQKCVAQGLNFGRDLLKIALLVNPGRSRLRGLLSDRYHKLSAYLDPPEMNGVHNSSLNGDDDLVLMRPEEISAQFKFDRGFHADNVGERVNLLLG